MNRILLPSLLFVFIQTLSSQPYDLDFYVSRAVGNSPQATDYQNRIRATAIDSMRLKASRQFQVKAVSNDYYAPVINGYGLDEVVTDGANLSAMVEITRDLTGRNNLLNQIRSLQLQKQSDRIEGQLTQQDLRRSVISQYILAFGAQQQVAADKDILALLTEEEKIIKQLTEAGIYRQTEYLALLVNLRQQQLRTRQALTQSKVELSTLHSMCGMADTAWHILADPRLTVVSLPDVTATLPYMQFQTDSIKLVVADNQIDYDYKPKLSVFANGGYLSSLTYMPWKNFGAMAGLSLTVPLYDGGQKKMQHDQIAISRETQSGYMKFYKNQYRQQVAALQRQLVDYTNLRQESDIQLQYTETLIKASQKLLNSGDIPVTDYILSVNSYIDAKNIVLQHTLTLYMLINEINYWSQSN